MASSTSKKFNKFLEVKEQLRKSIAEKGVKASKSLPLEQYPNKIESIYFYDPNDSTFNSFLSSYFTNIANNGFQFYSSSITQISTENLNQMG